MSPKEANAPGAREKDIEALDRKARKGLDRPDDKREELKRMHRATEFIAERQREEERRRPSRCWSGGGPRPACRTTRTTSSSTSETLNNCQPLPELSGSRTYAMDGSEE